MNKQMRIMIGDIGDDYAANCAAAFCAAGDWAVTRPQRADRLPLEIRREHPDALILNLTRPNMSFPQLTEEIQRHTEIAIVALYRIRNSELEQRLIQQSVQYRPFPKNPSELIPALHALCGVHKAANPQHPEPELAVTRLLHSFGIPTNLRGYHYLRTAILYAYEQDAYNGCMMNLIYPAVAEICQSTSSRVERSIRHAILQAWENSDYNAGWQFGIPEHHRMTNSEFIAFAVDWLRTEHASRRLFG